MRGRFNRPLILPDTGSLFYMVIDSSALAVIDRSDDYMSSGDNFSCNKIFI